MTVITAGDIWYDTFNAPFRVDSTKEGWVFYAPIGGNPGLASGKHTEANFRYYFNPHKRA